MSRGYERINRLVFLMLASLLGIAASLQPIGRVPLCKHLLVRLPLRSRNDKAYVATWTLFGQARFTPSAHLGDLRFGRVDRSKLSFGHACACVR